MKDRREIKQEQMSSIPANESAWHQRPGFDKKNYATTQCKTLNTIMLKTRKRQNFTKKSPGSEFKHSVGARHDTSNPIRPQADCCGIIYALLMTDVTWPSSGSIDLVSPSGASNGKLSASHALMIRSTSGKNSLVSFIFPGLGRVTRRKKKASLRK